VSRSTIGLPIIGDVSAENWRGANGTTAYRLAPTGDSLKSGVARPDLCQRF